MDTNENSVTIITVYFAKDYERGLVAMDGGLPDDTDAADRAFDVDTTDIRRLNFRLSGTPTPFGNENAFPPIDDALIGFRVIYDEDGDVSWVACTDNADDFDELNYSYTDVTVPRELVESLFVIPVVDATIIS